MITNKQERIYLSPPHMSGLEEQYVQEAFDTNWIAPVGPNINEFEKEFCQIIGSKYAVALSSGTAALHLALLHLGIGSGDKVLVSTLTFAASVNPIIYVGAEPIFVDSERESWNVDPELLSEQIIKMITAGTPPTAVIVVHLYGQATNMQPIVETCAQHNIPVIEDAAEALGGFYQERPLGSIGRAGVFSFNGNKIITTSGGGMLVSDDKVLIEHVRKLATQARDEAPHYQHSEIGYNYRMSNVVAGIGRGQLAVLSERVEARRQNAKLYQQHLSHLPGITIMPEAPWSHHNRWLSVIVIEPELFGATRENVRLALESQNIEARPVWKPMHLQPVYAQYEQVGGQVAEHFFEFGLCLPSGSSLQPEQIARICEIIKGTPNSILI